MAQKQTPNWQPISALPMIASMVDSLLEGAQEQYETLQEARDRPYVLNDAIVERIIKVYTAQLADLWLYEGQLARWKKEHLTSAQEQEIGRLDGQVERVRKVLKDILSLADKLKDGTIEKVLAKDDAELALEVLAGKWKV